MQTPTPPTKPVSPTQPTMNSTKSDNRVMFSVGKTAMEMHLLGNDVNKILGIPLSVSGKNKYFDLGAFHPSTTGK